MNTSLPEITPDAFVRRALTPAKRSASAMVVEPASLDIAAHELRTTLRQMNVSFVEAELDGKLQLRREALRRDRPVAVVVTSDSEDPDLWHRIDLHRSRLEDGATTLFLLSRNAAKSMYRNAFNLVSLLGPLRYYHSALESLIDSAANACYPELYEAIDHRPAKDIKGVIDVILNAFGDPLQDEQAWRRFGHMGCALLIEVLPTISGHWPRGTATANAVLAALEKWLTSPSAPSTLSDHIDGPHTPQALAEAIDVVRSSARLTDRARARDAIANMVDDCLEGYAMFPGSEGRRCLFDWWLHVVVPAAWAVRRPARFSASLPKHR